MIPTPVPTRRHVLKLGALAAAAPLASMASSPRRVIVAGAGIGGLSCAWELTRRGHDVVVIEAAARTGGHVRTVREGLDEGLYADAGAEHFTQPGYERFWSYVREFELPYLYTPRRRACCAGSTGGCTPRSSCATGPSWRRWD